MIFRELSWIRENAPRLEWSLRQDLMNYYKPARWIPCIFHNFFVKIRHRHSKVPVIITTKEDLTGIRSDIKMLMRGQNFRIQHHIPIMNSYTGELSLGAIKELARHPEIKKIYHDGEVRAILDVATPTVGANRVWKEGFKGKGVGIAILDTGIAPHADLTQPKDRIIAFKDFVKNRTKPYDDNGHGTHVAGDAAGNGQNSKGKYQGPAPEANLLGVKVLNREGSGRKSQVLAGIQWCIENKEKYNIRIINMSLGSRAEVSYMDDPICHAVEKAWEAGIVVMAAAGNEGPEARTISSPGSHPRIITIGAMDDRGTIDKTGDALASFSSRGPTPDGINKPDIVAPGVNVISLRADNSQLDKRNSQNRVNAGYFSLSGTSMATPIAAGVVAQIIECNPRLTPDEVKEILLKSADAVEADRNLVGAGYVNARAALTMAKKWRNGGPD